MPAASSRHDQRTARSYLNLQRARLQAVKTSGYDSTEIRARLTSEFRARMHSEPYSWQLDVTEAILLGLDSVVIAGTGSGKTMPFMMPLTLDAKKKIIIISPLKVLQEDQAERFVKMGLTAAAINGDTWNKDLAKALDEGRFQGLLTSPEMCLKHREFRSKLTTTQFQDICAVVIDEAHCIGQWGGDFRTAYSELGKLRSFFPPHIPILATSATFTPSSLKDARAQLGIDADESFFLNLGNDRPNVAFNVHTMKSSTDFEAVKPFLSPTATPTNADDLHKSIIFVNNVVTSQLLAREVRSWLPPHLHKFVDYLHAHRSRRSKRSLMRRFRKGEVKILIATEAAGMGADIPDVKQVIQFGVPSSLCVWVQRAGRAGRSAGINARAILLVEQSMFERQKIGRKKPPDTRADESEEEEEGDGDDEEADEGEVEGRVDTETHTWKKKVDEHLRRWIEVKGCRRDVLDEYFENPPNRKSPTHVCCDNCEGTGPSSVRPQTPPAQVGQHAESAPSTPSKSPDSRGKRKRGGGKPGPRRGEHLEQARLSLEAWRHNTKYRSYGHSPFTVQGFMSDTVLTKLASSRVIQTPEDVAEHTGWIYAPRHGQEILQLLKNIDEQKQTNKQAKADARKEATRQRNQEKKDQETQEREAEKRKQELEKQLQAPKPQPSSTARQPLAGCLTVNFKDVPPQTPSAIHSRQPFSVSTPANAALSSPSGMLLDFQVGRSSTPTTLPAKRPYKRRMLSATQTAKPAEPSMIPTSQTENLPPPPMPPRPRPRPRPIIKAGRGPSGIHPNSLPSLSEMPSSCSTAQGPSPPAI